MGNKLLAMTQVKNKIKETKKEEKEEEDDDDDNDDDNALANHNYCSMS